MPPSKEGWKIEGVTFRTSADPYRIKFFPSPLRHADSSSSQYAALRSLQIIEVPRQLTYGTKFVMLN